MPAKRKNASLISLYTLILAALGLGAATHQRGEYLHLLMSGPASATHSEANLSPAAEPRS